MIPDHALIVAAVVVAVVITTWRQRIQGLRSHNALEGPLRPTLHSQRCCSPWTRSKIVDVAESVSERLTEVSQFEVFVVKGA